MTLPSRALPRGKGYRRATRMAKRTSAAIPKRSVAPQNGPSSALPTRIAVPFTPPSRTIPMNASKVVRSGVPAMKTWYGQPGDPRVVAALLIQGVAFDHCALRLPAEGLGGQFSTGVEERRADIDR